ncbi:hypothetical protein [Paenibacillus harenae]|uniref:Uncharacterized protein n=1 Tax=Paenibacillus harenae TaxID=306543 RepID=A0ABT9U472_PAEHA|nr:hypothetical protein [Paenibacillus harenae]MDQ0114363.1 hypothetical protein [Paenibacillus harenae]
MTITSEWKIRHNGNEYPAGEAVTLPEADEKRLVDSGLAEYTDGGETEQDLTSDDPLTPDEFSKLKADEQKVELLALSIEPAGNSEDRLKQYSEWFEANSDGGLKV